MDWGSFWTGVAAAAVAGVIVAAIVGGVRWFLAWRKKAALETERAYIERTPIRVGGHIVAEKDPREIYRLLADPHYAHLRQGLRAIENGLAAGCLFGDLLTTRLPAVLFSFYREPMRESWTHTRAGP